MNLPTQRTIFRCIHIIVSIPILGYIYSPFERLPDYAPATRFVFLPIMVLRDCGCGKGICSATFFEKAGLTTAHPHGATVQADLCRGTYAAIKRVR